MRPPKKNPWEDDDDNKQNQGQGQGQAQAELQGQLQGQGQAQGQLAAQAMYQESDNKSENDNKNDNENDNKNSNENKLENDVDNKLENKVENGVNNDIENKVENTVESKVNVEVKVDVGVDLDLEGYEPTDHDLIDIDSIDADELEGALVTLGNDIHQDVDGSGNDNAFNLQQVNTLVDNDKLESASVSYGGYGDPSSCGLGAFDAAEVGGGFNLHSGFIQAAYASGGTSGAVDATAELGDNGVVGSNASSADAIVNQEAFTQNIVMGANIQFNSVELSVVGDDVADSIL